MSRVDREQDQFRRAAFNYDNASPSYASEAEEDFCDAYMRDAANIREAADWVGGDFEPDHYVDMDEALYHFADCDVTTIVGTKLFERLLRLAKVRRDAIHARLEKMADVAWQAGRRDAA